MPAYVSVSSAWTSLCRPYVYFALASSYPYGANKNSRRQNYRLPRCGVSFALLWFAHNESARDIDVAVSGVLDDGHPFGVTDAWVVVGIEVNTDSVCVCVCFYYTLFSSVARGVPYLLHGNYDASTQLNYKQCPTGR